MRLLFLLTILPLHSFAASRLSISNLRVETNLTRVDVNRPDSDICGLSVVSSKFLVRPSEVQALSKKLRVTATSAHTGKMIEIPGQLHKFGLLFYPTSQVYGYANTFTFQTQDGQTLKSVLDQELGLGKDEVVIIDQIGCEDV